MKITGTKKITIALLSLTSCAAAGLGVLFGGWFSAAPKAYAQSEQHMLPVAESTDALEELSTMSGFSEEDLLFYVNSNNGSTEMLYSYYLADPSAAKQAIADFLYNYSKGMLVNDSDMSEEDWYVAPDEVGNYNFTGCQIGLGDTWTTYYTTKAFVSNESIYWGEESVQWGHLEQFNFRSNSNGLNATHMYAKNSTVGPGYWDSAWEFDIVWLEEGEEFEWGIYTNKKHNQKYCGAMTTDHLIDCYLTEKPFSVRDYSYSSGSSMYLTGRYWGRFTDYDTTTPVDESDPANFEPVTTPRTKGDYRDEFSSNIANNTNNYAQGGNTPYLKWTSDSLPAGNAGIGVHKLRVSRDAPSGLYYMGFKQAYHNSYWSPFFGGTGSTSSKPSTVTTTFTSISGWPRWNYWINYGVWVCRKNVTAPTVKFGDGVASDYKSKTVSYNGDPQSMVIEHDWGPGLTTMVVEEWDSVGNSWVPATNLTVSGRPTAGADTCGETTFTATNAGKYRVTYTPFKKWKGETGAAATAPKEYLFEIRPMKLEMPALVQEEGVDQSTNTKFLYATKKDLYVSVYPVPSSWTSYTAPGLSVFNYSANGVLTLSQKTQGTYTITVTINDTVNVAWDDGTTNGSIQPLTFTFEIGPEKVVVPDIIQDTGQITAFKKEVIFNGAVQTMSFMPINPDQLDISVQNMSTGNFLVLGFDYFVSDNTLVVNALDAATYEIRLSVKPQYIFSQLSTELVYELVIHEAEIEAPILSEPTAVNNKKTVQYGGEKITMPDGTTQDWVATLTFTNADEARIQWDSNGLSQQTWGDSTLVLSARSAATYTVSFKPQKNYKWKTGVNPPVYTLEIEKLIIADPTLINDGEAGATYAPTSKTVGFDGNPHDFKLKFPTHSSAVGISYTKKSSVFIVHNGSFTENWNDAAGGDEVSFSGVDAGTFTFTVTPTNNYCWSNGTSDEMSFTFKIIPVNVDALEMYATGDYSDDLVKVNYASDTGHLKTLQFDGKPKTVRIGNPNAADDAEKYVTSGSFEKYFFMLDEDGNPINRVNDGLTGIAAKLPDHMTADETGGYLTLTAIDAGTYRIGVYIRNTNFWWTETESTLIVYTLVIEAQGIAQPQISEADCLGRDIAQGFKKDAANATYSMSGIYYNDQFVLVAKLDKKFRGQVKITDPEGNVYVHDASKMDSTVKAEADAALAVKGGVYTYWANGSGEGSGEIKLYAKDRGDYTWTLEITDTNYKWAGTTATVVKMTISIDRSPVSGLEMHFVGDLDEEAVNTSDGVKIGSNVRGSDPTALLNRYDATTFSDEEKVLFFVRTNTDNLIDTGFSTQFTYSIKSYSSFDGYDASKLKPLDKNKDGTDHFNFDDAELRLYALDAGTYEITLTPSDNYCWNDTGKTFDPVMFTLVIKKRQLERPVIVDEITGSLLTSAGARETNFNREYQTFVLQALKYTQGYAVGSFEYFDTENRVGNDFAPVETSGTVTVPANGPDINYEQGFINIGESFDLGADPDKKSIFVRAKSAGDYELKITPSNENNYEFVDGNNNPVDTFSFTYKIKKLKVELPTAYLSDQKLQAADAAKKILDYNDVANQTSIGLDEAFASGTGYVLSRQYCGKFYTVYFYGADVKGGDFVFNVTTATTNGVADIKQILPADILVDNTADATQKAGYYMLAAAAVNQYKIELKFTTKDFYWSTETPDAQSTSRTFTFNVNKNVISIPRINSDPNSPLVNESYTAEFDYALDPANTNGAKAHSIQLQQYKNGVWSDVMLGDEVSLNATTGVYQYSNITVKVSSLSTAGAVLLGITHTPSSGTGLISVSTASTVGSVTSVDGGLVPNVYCVELEINPANSEWDTDVAASKSANKLYYIKVNKMKVERPYLDQSFTDVISKTQLTRHKTYSGDVWGNLTSANDFALYILGCNFDLMAYTGSGNLIVSPDTDFTNSIAEVASTALNYDGKIKVKTPAPADTYTLTVKLADSANMEWKDGSVADIVFEAVMDKIKVAKPYIENTLSPSTSVVGLTKTVTYDTTAQTLSIGNYWYDYNITDTPLTNSAIAPSVIPDIMEYSVVNGTLDSGFPTYTYGQFTNGQKYGSMTYNDFNNGLLNISATNAGSYVIRFTLSQNAVWADGSNADVDVTLLIKKAVVDDLQILDASSNPITGTEKKARYSLDSNGAAVPVTLDLTNYDPAKMSFDGVTLGNSANITDNGAQGTNGYKFTASLADTYEVSFKLTDGANYRWKYADTDMAYFKLVIEKLELDIPEIHLDYKLTNETYDDATRTLKVDYDMREHTVLVKSLFEKQNNGSYDNGGTGVGSSYFTVADTTATDFAGYNSAIHGGASVLTPYDSTTGKTVYDLHNTLGTGTYDGANKTDATSLSNLFTIAARKPGDYYMTFTLTDTANMCWKGGAITDVKFVVSISKVQHAIPARSAGDPGSKEYTGTDVLFRIENTYNGVVKQGDSPTQTVSEKYTIAAYTGPDATLSTAAGLAAANAALDFEESWFNGTLTLKFTSIGVYTLRVSITDTDNISWIGTNDTTTDITLAVTERILKTEILFNCDSDSDLNAKLEQNPSAPEWPLDKEVYASITVRGLRQQVGSATTADDGYDFEIYFEDSANPGVKLQPQLKTVISPYTVLPQPDGTFIAVFKYTFPYGKGNLAKGVYKLHIVQDSTTNPTNYILNDPQTVFTVEAEPAPFKGRENMLQWSYSRSDEAPTDPKHPITGLGTDPSNPFISDELKYEDGISYTFHLELNATGMNGFDNAGYTDIILALNSWKVTWNGAYSGTRVVSNAGSDSVSVTITALNANEYSFANYTFTLYYKVAQAKYDLSKLTWNYDGSTPFTFDGTAKSVAIQGLTATDFPNLSIDHYVTTGTFVSKVFGNPDYVGPVSIPNGNSIIYAGKYTTKIVFKVPAVSNYELPSDSSSGSYLGSFAWTVNWEIAPEVLEVEWVQTETSSSDGDKITKTAPAIDGVHANKFKCFNELWDTSLATPAWVAVTTIERKPGQVLKYRATPYLISQPSNPANDFARNYTFKLNGDNPLEYEVGGDDRIIVNHIEIDGKTLTQYEYTGNPLVANYVIDFDTTNGLIGTSSMSINIVYYAASAPTVPLSGAPHEVGSYIVKLKLLYTGTEDYALSQDTLNYTIEKAKLKNEDFSWHVKHDDGTNVTEAMYDAAQAKWIDIATKEEYKIVYDGHSYDLSLVSDYPATVISFLYTDNVKIDAGQYTAVAAETIDTVHYEIDASDPLQLSFNWEIEKKLLDLSKISWDYTKPYEFTLVNGTPKAFKAELKDLPEYLLDKISYSVVRGTASEPVVGDVTEADSYKTTATIDTTAIDANNYTLGTWPASVPTTLSWVVARKEINVPVNDMSWTEFDGIQHNLLKPFSLDIDWAEYFDIDVTYTDSQGIESAYDGTAKFGGKYYAYDAGVYTFTFKIHTEFNASDTVKNIVWVIKSDNSLTDNDQTVNYTVGKKKLKVTGWIENYESSKVILANGIDSTKFIEYNFYEGAVGASGTATTLDAILESGGGDTFSMVPVVKKAYAENIDLTFTAGTAFTTFTTKTINEDDAEKVNGKPYIYGYKINGVFKRFSNDELASGETFVVYSGDSVEFMIFNWDTYYKNYLEVWNGSLDDLTQQEAGKYELTLVLRKDLDKPLYWGLKEDNKIDRSSVTLKYEIRYRMLTIPDLPEEVVYEGSEIDIFTKATNATRDQLIKQYGDYVEIKGDKSTDVGEQVLYLAIKDEYGTAVRWDDGSEQGLLGTYSAVWKIKPILLVRPEKNPDAKVEYDGTEHSVYEFLKGYDKENIPQALKDLMKYISESNGRSIDAGTFNATLSLPSTNYAWSDAAGNELSDRSAFTAEWTIDKKLIDFSKAYWGYMDGGEPVAYDATKPFVYTVKQGAAVSYSVQIIGMPDILKLYAKYTTNGTEGNSASAVDTYTTRVEYDLSKLDTNNYTVGNQLSAELSELEWKIVPREFDLPVYDESWKVFDGDVHDIIKMLGLGDDWADYFDITVEYKVNEGDSYAKYNGENMLVVGFSNYKAYNFGFYRITVSLKTTLPLYAPGNLVWKESLAKSAPQPIEIEVLKREVNVVGWFDDNEYSTVIFKDGETLPEGISEKFEYVIYADGDVNKTPVKPEDIEASTTYFIEFRVKSGSSPAGVAYSYGIDLKFADGVTNIYEFGSYDFTGQSIIWVPMPVLETASLEYNGDKQTFTIKDFDTAYKLTDEQRIQLNASIGLKLDASVKSYIYLQDVTSLTATAADEYTAVVRLLNKVRLSWYDSELYEASPDHRTLYNKSDFTPVSDPDSLFNNKSFILKYNITPKHVSLLTDEDLEALANLVVGYDGTEKTLNIEKKDVFDVLEKKYGKIFEYSGNTGTSAGDYELTITLADTGSCNWYTEIKTETKDVNVEGYKLSYVRDGAKWKIIFAKVDDEGNIEKDAAGKFVKYDGDYTIDVAYMPEFETEIVAIDVNGDGSKMLLNTDGSLIVDNSYFFNGGNHVTDEDGNNIVYEYERDESGNIIQYVEVPAGSGIFVPSSTDSNSDGINDGTHVKRIKLSMTAEKKYGYKVYKTVDATEYTYLYSNLTLDGDSDYVPAIGPDGNPITRYLVLESLNYVLYEYTVTNNKLVLPGTKVEDPVQLVNVADRYKYSDGDYVIDNVNGGYMLRYVLNPDGTRKQTVKYATDDEGRYIIDQEHSKLNVNVYVKPDEDVSYKVSWKIDKSKLAMPVFDETLMKQYTGQKIYAKDVLKGFLPDLMEIIDGGEGVNAGEYTAKIIITSKDSSWNEADTTEEYVLVTWRIATAEADLSDIKWVYTDGTNTYEDSSSFVYSRKDGKPVVYWVELANLPEVLKDRVVYTTNGKEGAYAGSSAGKYITTFTFKTDENFEEIVIPETLETSVTWNIKRRMLEVPDLDDVFMVYDTSSYNLLEVLGVPEGWNEYFDIAVEYSDGGEYAPFTGTEENPFLTNKPGSYRFTFTIKSGINTTVTNPNVVWLKKAEVTPPEEGGDAEGGETEGGGTEGGEVETPPESESFAVEEREVRRTAPARASQEVAYAEAQSEEEASVTTECEAATVKHHAEKASLSESIIKQICDRLEKLISGAEVQFKSFKKYSMRGTL